MYISPDSKIKLLRGVPLDPNYENTLSFVTKEEQQNTFQKYVKYSFTEQYYQRSGRGFMRIQMKCENLYDCNYLMFQNTAFGDKWFYAFIKTVEYINNSVSQIEYEIDVMQTWHFDYALNQCYVEREHSASDELFANLVPENVDIGDDVVTTKHGVISMNKQRIGIMTTSEPISNGDTVVKFDPVDGSVIHNIYSGIKIITGLTKEGDEGHTDESDVDRVLSLWKDNGKADDVISVFQYPSFLSRDNTAPLTFEVPINLSDIDGYVPKNKKLFTYPYNYLIVSNNDGNIVPYKWENWSYDAEYFEDYKAKLKTQGTIIPLPIVVCYPCNYLGQVENFDCGIIYDKFPTCCWGGDAFKAWWAQNKSTAISGIITSAGQGALSGAAMGKFLGLKGAGIGALIGAGISLGTAVSQSIAEGASANDKTVPSYGNLNSDSLTTALQKCEFSFYYAYIKKEYAKIIDDYFTRFGYAVKTTKVPNTDVRSEWCYTKTIGCTIKALKQTNDPQGIRCVPADDAKKICSIFDNGITFWQNDENVGNYTLDNSPIG